MDDKKEILGSLLNIFLGLGISTHDVVDKAMMPGGYVPYRVK